MTFGPGFLNVPPPFKEGKTCFYLNTFYCILPVVWLFMITDSDYYVIGIVVIFTVFVIIIVFIIVIIITSLFLTPLTFIILVYIILLCIFV